MPEKPKGPSKQYTIRTSQRVDEILRIGEIAGIAKTDLINWCIEECGEELLGQSPVTRDLLSRLDTGARVSIESFRATTKVKKVMEGAKKDGVSLTDLTSWAVISKGRAFFERHIKLAKDLEAYLKKSDL